MTMNYWILNELNMWVDSGDGWNKIGFVLFWSVLKEVDLKAHLVEFIYFSCYYEGLWVFFLPYFKAFAEFTNMGLYICMAYVPFFMLFHGYWGLWFLPTELTDIIVCWYSSHNLWLKPSLCFSLTAFKLLFVWYLYRRYNLGMA